ncbi:MAG: cytochrome c oxidase subunit II [Alphaproteobacteria bacterium]
MPRRLPVWAKQTVLGAVLAVIHGGTALAAEGQPHNWEVNFQDAATPIAQLMHNFNNLLLAIMAAIVALVLALIVWVAIRYNEKANPKPSKTTHNTPLEIIWTVIPILILAFIAVPSFRLLYAQYSFPKTDLTIKATGHQWYWTYNYPDYGNFSFDSFMLEDSERKPGQPRLLSVDEEVVVPVGKVVNVLVTSTDVIHGWAVSSFGVKVDAVPGRVTRTWFKALKPGVYYGQCSQLCGANHAFMPIAVRVVSEQDFAAWVKKQQESAGIIRAKKIAAREVHRD